MPFTNASTSGALSETGIPTELSIGDIMFPGNSGIGTIRVATVKKTRNAQKIAPPIIFSLHYVSLRMRLHTHAQKTLKPEVFNQFELWIHISSSSTGRNSFEAKWYRQSFKNYGLTCTIFHFVSVFQKPYSVKHKYCFLVSD